MNIKLASVARAESVKNEKFATEAFYAKVEEDINKLIEDATQKGKYFTYFERTELTDEQLEVIESTLKEKGYEGSTKIAGHFGDHRKVYSIKISWLQRNGEN